MSLDGEFIFDEPGDGNPALDKTIPRLPDLSGLGTRHPQRRFHVRARDTYSRNVATEINAPAIELVFEATREALSHRHYTSIEVADITPKMRGKMRGIEK